MLAGDSNNRRKIANCIKKIPSEVYEQIYLLIQQSYETDEELSFVHIVNDYRLMVKIYNKELTISFGGLDNVLPHSEEEFLLYLTHITKEELIDRKSLSKKYIGKFVHIELQTKICKTCGDGHVFAPGVVIEQYNLLHNSLVSYVERERITEHFMGPIWSKKVNLDKIPDKMFIHQLDNEKRLNRLVREKVKKNNLLF